MVKCFNYLSHNTHTHMHTHSYSRGFGVIGAVLGEEHPLNVQNSIYGLVFYTLLFVLGELPWRCVTLTPYNGKCLLLMVQSAFVVIAYPLTLSS